MNTNYSLTFATQKQIYVLQNLQEQGLELKYAYKNIAKQQDTINTMFFNKKIKKYVCYSIL